LEYHLNLTSRLNVYIGTPRKEGYQPNRGKPGSDAAKSARERMSGSETGDRAYGSAGWNSYFCGLSSITRFVLILFDSSFAVPDFLLAGAGEAVHNAGDLNH
jgi:hypothetical protein